MDVVIIEDEKAVADNLESLLKQIDTSIKIIVRIGTIREAVKWLKSNHTDLIFLDIHLSDGLSFKIFEQTDVKTPVIFTTAYDKYAINAFKVNSIDYLLKPIDINELKKSITKYKEIHGGNIYSNINDIVRNISERRPEYQKRFIVFSGEKVITIKTENIAYLYIAGKSVFICTKNNNNYSIDYSLENLEILLPPDQFFRINRKIIINIDAIGKMYSLSKSRIKIELIPSSDFEVLVSFSRSTNFKKWLNQ